MAEVRAVPAHRIALLLPGAAALLMGLDAALMLLVLPAPLRLERLPEVHGMLLVLGFVGTLVAMERAIALGRWCDVGGRRTEPDGGAEAGSISPVLFVDHRGLRAEAGEGDAVDPAEVRDDGRRVDRHVPDPTRQARRKNVHRTDDESAQPDDAQICPARPFMATLSLPLVAARTGTVPETWDMRTGGGRAAIAADFALEIDATSIPRLVEAHGLRLT